MKKLLALFLVFLASLVHACPDEIRIVQRDVTDTLTFTRQMCPPNYLTQPSMMVQDPTTGQIVMANFTGLSWNGTTLSVSATGTQADWNATTGAASILNKPTLASVATSGAYTDLSGRPGLATVATSGQFSDLLGKPTTLSGYGITDGVTGATLTTVLSSYATSSALTTGLAGKFNTPTGTTAQYIRGDGSLATLPTTPARSFSYPTRALSTCFQISSTRDASFSYGVDITTTVTLAGTPRGTASLRIYTDNACTTGGQTVISQSNGFPTTLSVIVGQQMLGTVSLVGKAPAGAWERIETTIDSGTSSTVAFATRQGQEVLE